MAIFLLLLGLKVGLRGGCRGKLPQGQPLFRERELVTAYSDETLDLVWERMRTHGIGRLPVVDRKDPARLLGIVTRGDLIRLRK